ncbi:MAG: response regulator [Armatimonadetes bacterium]|jgi:DNA-binding NtrC family response regulator|nr:response regulator [Armatimonadota bacterium]
MIRILVVDDEDEVRAALARRLEREGYAVTTAGSEAEGLNALKTVEHPYDIVVTDMNMGDPNSGMHVLEGAASRDVFTEVIVLTAYGNVANAVECMRRGAFDYIEKNMPGIDVFELLVMKLEQACQRRRQSVGTVRRLEEFHKRHAE